MTEGYEKIGKLLTLTFSSSVDEIRRQAEEELKHLSSDSKVMIEVLLRLCADNTIPDLKLAAGTKLKHLLRENVESSSLTSQDKSIITEAIFKVMITNIPDSLRSIFTSCIITLIADDKLSLVSMKLSLLCSKYITGSVPEIRTSLLCIQAIFSSITTEFSTKDYFHKILPVLISLCTKAFAEFLEAFASQDLEKTSSALQVLDSWAETISHILDHFEMISPKILKEFLKHIDISNLLGSIILFKVNDKLLITDGSHPCVQLNSIKAHILRSLNVLMQYTIDSKKKLLEEQENISSITTLIGMDLPDTPFVNVVTGLIESLLVNLLQLSDEIELSDTSNQPISNFIIESLDLCIKSCGESRFFPIFAQYYRYLVVKVIPNGIHLTQNDKEQALVSPNEFVDLGFDICERQESDTVKTNSAKLLETICDNIDGALTYLVHLILKLLEGSIGLYIEDTQEILYYKSLDQETVVDLCIIMLSTVSYSVSRRKDLLSLLNSLFTSHLETLVTANSSIIQSRMCLLFYFYAEHIHLDSDVQLMKWVWYLINSMSSNTPPMVTIQACETFSSISQDEEIMLRLHPYLPNIFEKIIDCISTQKERSFFEALSEFLNWYNDINTDQVLNMISILVKKINDELNTGKEIIIQKCWNIIRNVSGNEFVPADHMLQLENILLPLIMMLNNPKKLSFEDEIIIVILGIIRKTNTISETQWQIFQILPYLQSKQENSLQSLLKLINLIVIHGKGHLQDSPDKLSSLVSIALQALYSKKSGQIKESYNSEGALLLQLLLSSFTGFLDKYLEKILFDVVSRYINPPIHNLFLKIRLLGVILVAFSYNFSLTVNILSKTVTSNNITYLRYVLIEIIQNYSGFKHPYDRRVAVLGLCQVFLQPSLVAEVSELGTHLFEAVILILSLKPEEDEQPNKKIESFLEKLMDSELDDMTDSEIMIKGTKLLYSNPNSNQSSEETEASLTVTQLVSPLTKLDEIAFFKEVLNRLQANNPQGMRSTVSSLSEDRKKNLMDIIMSQKVKILDYPGDNTVIRKIVKAKHSNK
jgi:hypothetical protein